MPLFAQITLPPQPLVPAISSLIIELDQRDPTPDKRVMIPLDGLKAVPEPGDRGDYNIQTRQSQADLLKLPPASTTSRGRSR